MSGRIPGNLAKFGNPFTTKNKSSETFNTPDRKQTKPTTLQSQLNDPFSSDPADLKKTSKPPPAINTPGGKTMPGLQPPAIDGHKISAGAVDTFSDLSKQSNLRKDPREVGTQKHGSLNTVQYQTAHGEFTHTQDNGKPGLFHQQINAEGGLVHARHDHTIEKGPFELKTQAEAALVAGKFEAGYHLNMDPKNPQGILRIGGEVISGVQGSIEGNVGNEHVGVGGKGEGFMGAKGKASADAVIDPKHGNLYVQAGYEGSAGMNGKATVKGRAGPLVGSAYVTGEMGVGSKGGVGFGMKDGILGGNIDLGGTLGTGGTVGVSGGVDLNYFNVFAKKQPEPTLTKTGNITPAGQMYADQMARQNPEPGESKLQRQENFVRPVTVDIHRQQGVNLAA